MNNETTSNVFRKTLQMNVTRYNSLVWDCHNLTQENDFNFFDLLLDVKKLYIEPVFTPLSEVTNSCLKECFSFWNEAKRMCFKNLMEESILVNISDQEVSLPGL